MRVNREGKKMKMEKQKDGLSLIVQLNDSVSLNMKSDVSKLNDCQKQNLNEFISSMVKQPKELVKEVSSFPYVCGDYHGKRAYPVGQNKNYLG